MNILKLALLLFVVISCKNTYDETHSSLDISDLPANGFSIMDTPIGTTAASYATKDFSSLQLGRITDNGLVLGNGI